MEEVLVDTDIIIDFLRGHRARLKTFFVRVQERQIKPLISLISIVELYSGKEVAERKRKEFLEKVLSYFQIIPPNLAIAKKAGELRREYSLGIVDALIAATCLSQKMSLFTFNQKHFQKIEKIKFYEIQ